MNKIEILAPSGNMESLFAAVKSGADAVYLGAKDFSARASADNFTYQQLKEAVEYCHINRVKVYLTLNTVVFDDELEKAKEVITNSAEAGIDALIVQNLGVASLAQKIAPDLPLHASTQMSIHSPSGAKLLKEMGFKRVVLSREMSLEEIKEVKNSCDIELEVFVHGALCMSVSGQCYFSAMLGSRSGNRGRCAQPCRLPFEIGKSKYALSLKDNSLVDYIRELEKIGVTSAKIEGRMKRPEYVSSAVRACKEMRDNGFVSEKTADRLSGVFSRTGFTDGYLTGKRGYEMFGYRQKQDVVSATSQLLSEIRLTYKDELKKISLFGKMICNIDEKPLLIFSDGENEVQIQGEVLCEKALKKPLDEERVKAQLSKTGGTPYFVREIEVKLQENVTLPMSVLNDLRRKAIEKLNEKAIKAVNYKINQVEIPKFQPYKNQGTKKTYIRLPHTNVGKGFKEADLCFFPLFSNEKELKRLIDEGFNVGVEIPRGLFGRENKIIEKLKALKNVGITDVLCNNLGAVNVTKQLGMKIHGGFGLNFVNTLDILWAESYGFEDTEVSFELTFSQIEKLGGSLKRGIISYGYLPLMLVRNCPNKSNNVSCRDCSGQGKMQDRLNKSFIFYCDGCTAEIINCAVVSVVEFVEKTRSIDFEVFRITVENSVENVENILDFLSKQLNFVSKTHGLYVRGII